jgi:hypothetical protein
MSVERRLRQRAQTVTRQLQEIDQEALLAKIQAAVQADGDAVSDVEQISREGSCPQVGALPGCSSEDGEDEGNLIFGFPGGFEQELHCHQQLAEKGDASSARRIAELWGLLDREDEAAAWWHRAAELGDPDAVDYVQEYLAETVDTDSKIPLRK